MNMNSARFLVVFRCAANKCCFFPLIILVKDNVNIVTQRNMGWKSSPVAQGQRSSQVGPCWRLSRVGPSLMSSWVNPSQRSN